MRNRILFGLSAAFFVTMNVLLWRAEFGGGRTGTLVPSALVWEKVVTSPDDSWLEVTHRGEKIGRAHWIAKIREDVPDAPPVPAVEEFAGENPPEGMVRQVTGYVLDFGGTVSLDEATRLRFDLGLSLDTNRVWQSLVCKFLIKPFSLELRADAKEKMVRVVIDEETRKEYTYSFADLRNPDKLLRDLGGPLLPAALSPFLLPVRQAGAGDGPGVFTWEARQDRLQIGRADMRVFRIEARLFERYRAVIFLSPVGEVLRIELPDDLILANDALNNI